MKKRVEEVVTKHTLPAAVVQATPNVLHLSHSPSSELSLRAEKSERIPTKTKTIICKPRKEDKRGLRLSKGKKQKLRICCKPPSINYRTNLRLTLLLSFAAKCALASRRRVRQTHHRHREELRRDRRLRRRPIVAAQATVHLLHTGSTLHPRVREKALQSGCVHSPNLDPVVLGDAANARREQRGVTEAELVLAAGREADPVEAQKGVPADARVFARDEPAHLRRQERPATGHGAASFACFLFCVLLLCRFYKTLRGRFPSWIVEIHDFIKNVVVRGRRKEMQIDGRAVSSVEEASGLGRVHVDGRAPWRLCAEIRAGGQVEADRGRVVVAGAVV